MFVSSLRRLGTLGGKSVKSDPFTALSPQIEILRLHTLRLVEANSPVLSNIATYYLQQPSKQIRPLLALLFSLATNGLGKDWHLKLWESTHPGAGGCEGELDIPLSSLDILPDYGPQHHARFGDTFAVLGGTSHFPGVLSFNNRESLPRFLQPLYTFNTSTSILPTQVRFAAITEMIHAASLLHDDVIDGSALRRGVPSAPRVFPPNLCVLCGHFMASLASILITQLRHPGVTRMMSKVQTNLIEGEMLQAKGLFEVNLNGMKRHERFHHMWNTYLQKSYLKTGALIARGARAVVVLGGCVPGEIWSEIAYAYGRNFGIAFQIADDVLDVKSSTNSLGKPGNMDLSLGLVTAPTLYAWEEYPEMGELMERKFQSPGDDEKALGLIYRSSAISRSTKLAQDYADGAKKVLRELPSSAARDLLELLADYAVSRDK